MTQMMEQMTLPGLEETAQGSTGRGHWPMVKLGDVAPARASKREFLNDELVWDITLDQIESNTGKIVNKRISKVSDAPQSSNFVDEDNVLYSKLRPYLNKVIIPNEKGFATTELVPLFPDKKRIDKRFLLHFLMSPGFVSWATNTVAGAKMPRLTMSEFWKHEIPLPPLPEQQRIVARLDKAQQLIDQRKEQLKLMDALVQSLFYEMFGDPVKNEKGWEVKKFGEVGSLDRGVSKHRPRNASELLGGPYPLIQTGDVANSGGYIKNYKSTYSEIGLKQSKLWPRGTLCITIAANIADTGILQFDACFPDSVVGFLSPNFSTVVYVRTWLNKIKSNIEEVAPAVAQKNINLAILRDLDIPFPPLSLQQAFADRVQQIEALKQSMTASLRELEHNFNALMQEAFGQ
jgi:type I restriction enzyme S subunit